MKQLSHSVFCAIFAALFANLAHAQDTPDSAPSRVVVRAPSCAIATVESADFARLLRIELLGGGVSTIDSLAHDASVQSDSSLAIVTIDAQPCTSDSALLAITIEDLATQKSVRRVVDLSDIVVEARARTLALAIAELLRASWAELVLPDAPRPAWPLPEELRNANVARLREHLPADERPTPVVAPPTRREPPRENTRDLAFVYAAFEGFSFPANARGLFGGRIALDLRIPSVPLRFQIDAGLLTSSSNYAEGKVSMSLVNGGLGLFLTSGRNALFFDIGPRFQFGWGWANGTPRDSTVTGNGGGTSVAMLSASATVRFRVAAHAYGLFGADLGVVTKELSGTIDGVERTSIAGEFFSVRLGIGYNL